MICCCTSARLRSTRKFGECRYCTNPVVCRTNVICTKKSAVSDRQEWGPTSHIQMRPHDGAEERIPSHGQGFVLCRARLLTAVCRFCLPPTKFFNSRRSWRDNSLQLDTCRMAIDDMSVDVFVLYSPDIVALLVSLLHDLHTRNPTEANVVCTARNTASGTRQK